jgi:hypothetical protein
MAEIMDMIFVKDIAGQAGGAVAEGGRSLPSHAAARPFLQDPEIAATPYAVTQGSTPSRRPASAPEADVAGYGHGADPVPRSGPFIPDQKERDARAPGNTRDHAAPVSPPVFAPSLTIAPGAVVIGGGTKPPEEQARELVKHIRAELERLAYRSR